MPPRTRAQRSWEPSTNGLDNASNFFTHPTNGIMEISGLPSSQSQAASSAQGTEAASKKQTAADNTKMGKQDFLKLLVTQLRNQDPMKPMKGQEFAAQLAQFSSLEQLINIDETLSSQQGSNGILAESINSGLAADMLGTRVQAQGNYATWRDNGDLPLHFELGSPAASATITIRNSAGQVVRTEDLGTLAGGHQTFEWDGSNNDGETVPNGTYQFSIEATDSQGVPVDTTTFLNGTVDRVTFGQDGIMLWIGDTKVPLDQVRSMENP